MRKVKDILDVKEDIKNGILEVKVSYNNILLVDCSSGEAVKIGEIKNEQNLFVS